MTSSLDEQIAEKMGWERREIDFEGKRKEVWNRRKGAEDIYLFEVPPYSRSMSWAWEVQREGRITTEPAAGGRWVASMGGDSSFRADLAEAICDVYLMGVENAKGIGAETESAGAKDGI